MHTAHHKRKLWEFLDPSVQLYRLSQEERTKLREGVPYVKLYQYNPKHLCPKLNGFRDNGKWSLKLWQLSHTYWLPNSYWNWQEYVVSVMLISVLNIKLTCEWYKAINLNCKVPRMRVIVIHRVRSTIHHTGMLSGDVTWLVTHYETTACTFKDMQGYAFQASVSRISMTHRRADIDKANQLTAIVHGPEGSPQFYLAIISITVQIWT